MNDTRHVAGLKALSDQLKQLGSVAGGKALRSAAMTATLPTWQQLKATAPEGSVPHKTHKGRLVAPGFLRRSLRRSSWISRDKQMVRIRLGVRGEAFYGVQFVELGTSRMAAKPWLRPALESTQRQVVDRLADRLKRNIEKVARSQGK